MAAGARVYTRAARTRVRLYRSGCGEEACIRVPPRFGKHLPSEVNLTSAPRLFGGRDHSNGCVREKACTVTWGAHHSVLQVPAPSAERSLVYLTSDNLALDAIPVTRAFPALRAAPNKNPRPLLDVQVYTSGGNQSYRKSRGVNLLTTSHLVLDQSRVMSAPASGDVPTSSTAQETRASTGASPAPTSPRPQRKIACHFCRHRKLRCDSARPVCANCTRRSLPCSYDEAHKKRGPDRVPGRRKRKVNEHKVGGDKSSNKDTSGGA